MPCNILNNERGIALITTLLLMVMGFAIVVILLHMVTQGTKIAGIEQRYSTALEAAKGGENVIIDTILKDGSLDANLTDNAAIALSAPNDACFAQKRSKTTSVSNWNSCTDLTSDATKDPDLRLSLNNYSVYTKIVDTKETSDAFIYAINVRAEVPNSQEHSEISFLYRMEK